MNKHTLSAQEFVATTMLSAFQGFASSLPSTNVSQLKVYKESLKPEPPKDKTRLTFQEKLLAREKSNPEFKKGMEAARALMADELTETDLNPIARIRLKKGYSQTTLATKLGTSQSHIARIESGKVKMLFETAIKMSVALSVSLDELRPAIISETDVLTITTKIYG